MFNDKEQLSLNLESATKYYHGYTPQVANSHYYINHRKYEKLNQFQFQGLERLE